MNMYLSHMTNAPNMFCDDTTVSNNTVENSQKYTGVTINDHVQSILYNITNLFLVITPPEIATEQLMLPYHDDRDSRTLLHLCSYYGYDDTVRLLLNRDGYIKYINTRDKYGFTALGIACMQEYYDIILLLLNANAEVNNFEYMYISNYLSKLYRQKQCRLHKLLHTSFMRCQTPRSV